MKNRIFTIATAAALLLAAAVGLSSCSGKTNYDKLDKNGYTVSVKFDANGGNISGSNSNVIDVFCPANYTADENGNISISLLEPEDGDKRGANNAFSLIKYEHFLAGWYTTRTPIDPDDLSKGYTYSGKWDFANDKLTIPQNGDYSASEPQLTLYAAWIPYYTYEIYCHDENGSWSLLDSLKAISLTIPAWEDGKSTINMGNFPDRDDYTLDSVFADYRCTVPLSGSVRGSYDEDSVTEKPSVIKLYTTWHEGNYYKIYSAKDFKDIKDNEGYYELCADLDFSKTTWPASIKSGKFKGTIDGNGHTIKGISISSSTGNGGVFAELSDTAVIKNVIFEDITHTIDTGMVKNGSSFGLLAGKISEEATLENVKVSGKILIGDKCQNLKGAGSNYTMGYLCGSGTVPGVDISGIVCEKKNPDNADLTFEIIVDESKIITLLFPDD